MVEFDDQDMAAGVPGTPWRMYAAVVLAGVAVFGVVTWLLGLGPFAYRQVLYARSEVYILNLTDEAVKVSLDGGTPMEVVAGGYHRTPLVGGTTEITTLRPDGSVLEELEVFADGKPVMYNVMGAKCMVLADVSSYYYPERESSAEVVETYSRGEHRIIRPPGRQVVWPRETLRDQVRFADQGVSWVETVACPMIEKDSKHLLVGQLNLRLEDRKQKERDRKLRLKMMREGGDAVHDAVRKQGDGAKSGAPSSGIAPQGEAAGAQGAGAAGPGEVTPVGVGSATMKLIGADAGASADAGAP